jgi:hypothetical protein
MQTFHSYNYSLFVFLYPYAFKQHLNIRYIFSRLHPFLLLLGRGFLAIFLIWLPDVDGKLQSSQYLWETDIVAVKELWKGLDPFLTMANVIYSPVGNNMTLLSATLTLFKSQHANFPYL